MRALVRSELVKLRTVPSWVVGLVVGVVLTVVLGALVAAGSTTPCPVAPVEGTCAPPIGPNGDAVRDQFSFVHQRLEGDGTITARIAAFDGQRMTAPDGLEPWSKAGLVVKESTDPGATYASAVLTGGHGVRLQHDFVHDRAAATGDRSAAAPQWLRLSRSGDRITAHESDDGQAWRDIGTVRLDGLPSAVQVGLLVTSPLHDEATLGIGSIEIDGGPTWATATFDNIELSGGWRDQGWATTSLGAADPGPEPGAEPFVEHDGSFTVTGSGDVGPIVAGAEVNTIEVGLAGLFAVLLAVTVVATLSVTTEYRSGLIRTTFAAIPLRRRVLAAKLAAVGSVAFVGAFATAGASIVVSLWLRDQNDVWVVPVGAATQLRVIVGVAMVVALAAVLAVAAATILRRSAVSVTVTAGIIVLPYVLAVASVIPPGPADWLLRVTPAAAMAVQQSTPEHGHVASVYEAATGYFPLSPLAGFAVLCVWTAATAAAASVLVERRDP